MLPQWGNTRRRIYAVYREQLQLSTQLRTFVDFIAEALPR